MNSVFLNNDINYSLAFLELVASSKEHLEARFPTPIVWGGSLPYVHCNEVIRVVKMALPSFCSICIALSDSLQCIAMVHV